MKITPIHSSESDMKRMQRILKQAEVDSLIALQAALDAAVIWFNATEEGFQSHIRQDVAKANFYRLASKAGLPVI